MSLQRLSLAAVLVTAVTMGTASAAPVISGKFEIDIYQVADGGGQITSPGVQAVADNPLLVSGNLIDRVTYEGALNFNLPGNTNQTGSIGSFFATGSGKVKGLDPGVAARPIASNPFAITTIMDIRFIQTAISNGNLLHDDGVGLYVNGTRVPMEPGPPEEPDASVPTAAANHTFATSEGGAYRLIFVSTNGLPQVLKMTGDPAPLDAEGFGCRIDLKQVFTAPTDASLKFVLGATNSAKFCPDKNGGVLRLACSGQIVLEPPYSGEPIDTTAIECLISRSQCGIPDVVPATVRSIKISESGFVELECEFGAPD